MPHLTRWFRTCMHKVSSWLLLHRPAQRVSSPPTPWSNSRASIPPQAAFHDVLGPARLLHLSAAKQGGATSVSISLKPGLTVVVGPNNAGKSLLLESIAGIRRLAQLSRGNHEVQYPSPLFIVTRPSVPRRQSVEYWINSPTVQDLQGDPRCYDVPRAHDCPGAINDTVVVTVVTGAQEAAVRKRDGERRQALNLTTVGRVLRFWDDKRVSRLEATKDSGNKETFDYHAKLSDVRDCNKKVGEAAKHLFPTIQSIELTPPSAAHRQQFNPGANNGRFGFRLLVHKRLASHDAGADDEEDGPSRDRFGLQQMGAGTRHAAAIIMFLLQHRGETTEGAGLLNRNRQVLCVDEPETYLHPPQAQRLAFLLMKAAESSRVVITTHSLPLLRGIVEERFKAMRAASSREHSDWCNCTVDIVRLEGTCLFHMGDKHVQELASNGYVTRSGMLEALSHKYCVVTENPKDALLLDIAMNKLHPETQILWYGGGGKPDCKRFAQGLIVHLGVRAFTLFDVDGLHTPEHTPIQWVGCKWKEVWDRLGVDPKGGTALDELLRPGNEDLVTKMASLLTEAKRHHALYVPFGELEVLCHRTLKRFEPTRTATKDLSLDAQVPEAVFRVLYPELCAVMDYVHTALVRTDPSSEVDLQACLDTIKPRYVFPFHNAHKGGRAQFHMEVAAELRRGCNTGVWSTLVGLWGGLGEQLKAAEKLASHGFRATALRWRRRYLGTVITEMNRIDPGLATSAPGLIAAAKAEAGTATGPGKSNGVKVVNVTQRVLAALDDDKVMRPLRDAMAPVWGLVRGRDGTIDDDKCKLHAAELGHHMIDAMKAWVTFHDIIDQLKLQG